MGFWRLWIRIRVGWELFVLAVRGRVYLHQIHDNELRYGEDWAKRMAMEITEEQRRNMN